MKKVLKDLETIRKITGLVYKSLVTYNPYRMCKVCSKVCGNEIHQTLF